MFYIDKYYLSPTLADRKTYLFDDQHQLDLPNENPPPVPGAESLVRKGTKLPTRSPSAATSRPVKIWNAIWDDWYRKTGKVYVDKHDS